MQSELFFRVTIGLIRVPYGTLLVQNKFFSSYMIVIKLVKLNMQTWYLFYIEETRLKIKLFTVNLIQ